MRATVMANVNKEHRRVLAATHADVAELLASEGSGKQAKPKDLRGWFRRLRHSIKDRF
jgi:hypothetical protein